MIPLSDRILELEESATFIVLAKVEELSAAGVDVIDLGVGQPDFETPDFIKDAALLALRSGDTRYTHTGGKRELRAAIARWASRHGPAFEPANVVVSNGGKQALFNAFTAILNDGDEVIIPAPYWVSVPNMTIVNGGVPKIVKCPASNNFKISPEQLRSTVSPRTKAIYLNSPSNPTGMIYTKDELVQIGNIIGEREDIYIVSDEIYECIEWGSSPFVSIAEACPHLRERLIIISGVSKSFAMTGWRIGWAVAAAPVVTQMIKVQGLVTSSASSFGQTAALAALTQPKSYMAEWNHSYRARRDVLCGILGSCGAYPLTIPDGAFYLFVGIPETWKAPEKFSGLPRSTAFASYLLEETGVAGVPGVAFGDDERIRLCFAVDIERVREGATRMAALFQ